MNVFVRDLVASTTTLVSRAAGVGGAGANDELLRTRRSRATATASPSPRARTTSPTRTTTASRTSSCATSPPRTITLVSRATGAGGAPGDDSSDSRSDLAPRAATWPSSRTANNLSPDDNNAVINVFLRDLDESTTALASRANGAGGRGRATPTSATPAGLSDNAPRGLHLPARTTCRRTTTTRSPTSSCGTRCAEHDRAGEPGAGPAGAAANALLRRAHDLGRRPLRGLRLARPTNLVAGTLAGVSNIYRRDVLGDAPVATPALQDPAAAAGARPTRRTSSFTLSVTQLRINQRISQAAIRRLNAVEARLNGGLQARDLCGYSVGPPQLGAGITSAPAAASLAPASPADPAADRGPRPQRPGRPADPQRHAAADQPAHRPGRHPPGRRASTNRLEAGLTGGDVRAGQVTQGKLFDRLQILAKAPAPEPAASADHDPAPAQPARSGQRHPLHRAVEDQPAHRPGRGAQRQRPHPAPGDRPVGRRPAPGHPDGGRPGLGAPPAPAAPRAAAPARSAERRLGGELEVAVAEDVAPAAAQVLGDSDPRAGAARPRMGIAAITASPRA